MQEALAWKERSTEDVILICSKLLKYMIPSTVIFLRIVFF